MAPGWCWSPDWHHLSHEGQEQSRAATGRQVTLSGLSHSKGQAELSPHVQSLWPLISQLGGQRQSWGREKYFSHL